MSKSINCIRNAGSIMKLMNSYQIGEIKIANSKNNLSWSKGGENYIYLLSAFKMTVLLC